MLFFTFAVMYRARLKAFISGESFSSSPESETVDNRKECESCSDRGSGIRVESFPPMLATDKSSRVKVFCPFAHYKLFDTRRGKARGKLLLRREPSPSYRSGSINYNYEVKFFYDTFSPSSSEEDFYDAPFGFSLLSLLPPFPFLPCVSPMQGIR